MRFGWGVRGVRMSLGNERGLDLTVGGSERLQIEEDALGYRELCLSRYFAWRSIATAGPVL